MVALSGLLTLVVAEPKKAPDLGKSYQGNVEKVLAAESFTVVDQAGRIREALGLTPARSPALQLMGEDARARLTAAAPTNENTTVMNYDANGETLVDFGLNDGRPGLGVYAPNGKASGTLEVAKDGALKLTFFDEAPRHL